jgi:LPS-assembly lipoprotein
MASFRGARAALWPLAVLLTVLAGCGFQLRGQAALAPEFQRVALQGVDVYSELGNSLRALLEANGAEVVEVDPSGVLWILEQRFNSDVTGLGSDGKAREFRLSYRVRFRAETDDGRLLVAPDEVRLFRDYAYDQDQILGRSAAEEDLRRELTREAAWLVLLRLQAVPET